MADVYVRISDEPVARTSAHSDNTLNVDLDRYGVPVGVEVLGALEVTVDGAVCRCAPTPSASPAQAEEVPEVPENPLTLREAHVLRMLAGGLTNQQIARRERTSQSAIANSVFRATRKLGAESTVQAVVLALGRGYLKNPEQGGAHVGRSRSHNPCSGNGRTSVKAGEAGREDAPVDRGVRVQPRRGLEATG